MCPMSLTKTSIEGNVDLMLSQFLVYCYPGMLHPLKTIAITINDQHSIEETLRICENVVPVETFNYID